MELYQEEREFFGLNRIADSDDLNSNPDTMLVIEDPSSNSAMMCYRHVWLPKRNASIGFSWILEVQYTQQHGM